MSRFAYPELAKISSDVFNRIEKYLIVEERDCSTILDKKTRYLKFKIGRRIFEITDKFQLFDLSVRFSIFELIETNVVGQYERFRAESPEVDIVADNKYQLSQNPNIGWQPDFQVSMFLGPFLASLKWI